MSTLAHLSPTFPGPYAAELGGGHVVGCDATWSDPLARRVLHANLLGVAGAGDTAYLMQRTEAVGGAAAQDDDDLDRSVLTTVRVLPWTAAGATTQEHDA